MHNKKFSAFAWGVLGFTVLVILWGAFVRVTGSGAGCGSNWPLCNGSVVPLDAGIGTFIEYFHRITSGVAFIGALLLLVFSRRLYPTAHLVRKAAGVSFLLMVVEAGIGAGLVLLELVAQNDSLLRAVVIALHLINSLLLVGALALTAWFSTFPELKLRRRSRRTAISYAALALLLLLVGASGAVTALGDTLFPSASLAEGLREDFSPTAHFLIRLRVIHPLLAIITAMCLFGLGAKSIYSASNKRTATCAQLLVGSVMVQLVLGFANLLLLAPLALQLAHLLLANAVWIAFVYLAVCRFEALPGQGGIKLENYAGELAPTNTRRRVANA